MYLLRNADDKVLVVTGNHPKQGVIKIARPLYHTF